MDGWERRAVTNPQRDERKHKRAKAEQAAAIAVRSAVYGGVRVVRLGESVRLQPELPRQRDGVEDSAGEGGRRDAAGR